MDKWVNEGLFWVKTALEETEHICMHQEHCHTVVPIPFKPIAFWFSNPFLYYSASASWHLNACSCLCQSSPIQRQSITRTHSKTVMLSLSHRRSVNARRGLFADAKRQCFHKCIPSDECQPVFMIVTMPWLGVSSDSLSMIVPLKSVWDNAPMSQTPSRWCVIWLC